MRFVLTEDMIDDPLIKRRKEISTKQKGRLLSLLMERSGGACHYCDRPCHRHSLVSGKPPGQMATVEHLKTRHMGRRRYFDGGVVLSCQGCNLRMNKLEMRTRAGDKRAKSMLQEARLVAEIRYLMDQKPRNLTSGAPLALNGLLR